ncbi:MAG: DUF4432 family protein [Opitutaceae bacterium]|nr:DUF4432 family protein [Opitutaceae bacterium]
MASSFRPRATHANVPKIDHPLQLGGIRTGSLDAPGAGGGPGVRVAHVDTGSGLRFTVALDRGGDIVDAAFNDCALAYLTPNGLTPPSAAAHRENEWLRHWPGGLVTTCGPEYIGGARTEGGTPVTLHGRFSNTPAAVAAIINPDPRRGRLAMSLALVIRDTRMFGPNFEIRRRLSCTLGRPEIVIEDEVENIGDTPAAHHWLYHCNLGFPLLDEGARFIYRGRAQHWNVPPPPGQDILQPLPAAAINRLKRVPAPLAAHAGSGERGLVVELAAGRDGQCRVGLINSRRGLGLEFKFPHAALPRLAHWQHYGPRGAFVSGLEPFFGSLLGSTRDREARHHPMLQPGESRAYRLALRVLHTRADLRALAAHDGPVGPLG